METTLDALTYSFAPKDLPARQRHFNTALVVLGALVLAQIPLLGSTVVVGGSGEATYFVRGTWMHVGTQPFAIAELLASLAGLEDRASALVGGLALSVAMAARWVYAAQQPWTCALQLAATALALVQAMRFLEARGSMHLTTALIFAQASELICARLLSLETVAVAALIAAAAWIDGLVVTLPLAHPKHRGRIFPAELPVMHNSTQALILFTTIFEWTARMIPRVQDIPPAAYAALLLAGIAVINRYVPTTTPRDIVRNWRKEGFGIKGWRSEARMVAHVHRIVERNIYWNTILLGVLWTAARLLAPSASPTTLFLLTGAARRHAPVASLKSLS